MEKVIAVVVTYNRSKLLCECINALRSQTRKLDGIFVVNNGSTDDTEQWLQQQPDVEFITQKNVGSSGGFSTGINWAFKQNYTWMWLMDDDGYPKQDALENMLAADNGQMRLMNCAVLDKEDKQSFVWKTQNYKNINEVNTNIIEGIGHPFNGTMLHRKIVERVGVPQPKFFLWGDETEYYYRITKINKIPVCTVANSIHYHPTTAFSLKQDWDYTSGWKMYYYVRNRFFIHQVKFSNKALAFINYACFLVAFTGLIVLYQKTDKLKKISFLAWPAADAFANNFAATPPTILEKLKSKNKKVSSTTQLRNIRFSLFNIFNPVKPTRILGA